MGLVVRLTSLVGIGGLAFLSAAHPAPSAPGSSVLHTGIGVVKYGGPGNWSQLTNPGRYSVMIVGAANAPKATALPGRTLLYGCAVNIPERDWSRTCGVGWSTAVANGWVLRDAGGRYAPYSSSRISFLADIANPDYQHAWVQAILGNLASYPGISGVIIDNVMGETIDPADPPVRYPSSARYRAAMESFMDAVGPALRAKGYYVDVNASMNDTTTPGWESSFGSQCDGSQFLWWYRRIARDVDAFTAEYWQMNWDTRGSIRLAGTDSCSQNWDGWQRVGAAVQSLGKDFIPLESGTAGGAGVAKSTYLKASFLLGWNGGGSAFVYCAGGLGNYVAQVDDAMGGAPWTWQIGIPVAARRRVGVGWRRDFTGGVVLINPDATRSLTVHLGGPYPTVTLAPGTAQILKRRG
jgi:hypothetical protein